MDRIEITSRVYGEYRKGGHIQVNVGTTWMKNFQDAKEIESLLLGFAPTETAKVKDFITSTVEFGEGRVDIPYAEQDFSEYGFEKVPPA